MKEAIRRANARLPQFGRPANACTAKHIFEGKELYCELGPHRSSIWHHAEIDNTLDKIVIEWTQGAFTYSVEAK